MKGTFHTMPTVLVISLLSLSSLPQLQTAGCLFSLDDNNMPAATAFSVAKIITEELTELCSTAHAKLTELFPAAASITTPAITSEQMHALKEAAGALVYLLLQIRYLL